MSSTVLDRDLSERAAHPTSYKPDIMFSTTHQCNYRCRMCYWSNPEVARLFSKGNWTMPMNLFSRALAEVLPFCHSVCLAGSGEFLMDPLLDERLSVLGEALRQHPEVLLQQLSNGSLLTAEKLHFLRGVRRVRFAISLDSVDALSYASIRRPGSLPIVLSNILNLRDNLHAVGVDDVSIQLNMVLMKRNIFSLPDMLRIAHEVHATLFVDHPQGFGPSDLHRESLFGVPAFANAFLGQCKQLAAALGVEFNCPPPFAISEEEIQKYFDAKNNKHLQCYQLDISGPMQVEANGDVKVCCQLLVFGNLHEQSFADIYHSQRYTEYREAIAAGHPLPPCDKCRFLYRKAQYIYESDAYEMDIPPESRNLDPQPDFEKEGFFNWLDELSEKRLREELQRDYSFRGKRLSSFGLAKEIIALQQQQSPPPGEGAESPLASDHILPFHDHSPKSIKSMAKAVCPPLLWGYARRLRSRLKCG